MVWSERPGAGLSPASVISEDVYGRTVQVVVHQRPKLAEPIGSDLCDVARGHLRVRPSCGVRTAAGARGIHRSKTLCCLVEATWSKRPLLPKGLTSVEATLDVTSRARGSCCTECKAPLGPQPFITELPGAERDSGRVGV